MTLKHKQNKTHGTTRALRALAFLLLASALTAALSACGSSPQPTVDREGLRDRADQETDQI